MGNIPAVPQDLHGQQQRRAASGLTLYVPSHADIGGLCRAPELQEGAPSSMTSVALKPQAQDGTGAIKTNSPLWLWSWKQPMQAALKQ